MILHDSDERVACKMLLILMKQDLVKDIPSQCSEALDILHNHNICHGDFCHTNILVQSDRIVLSVIDFGKLVQ